MATPVATRPTRKRFLANAASLEVHDLESESSRCEIGRSIREEKAVVFLPDTLEQARAEGFRACPHCLR